MPAALFSGANGLLLSGAGGVEVALLLRLQLQLLRRCHPLEGVVTAAESLSMLCMAMRAVHAARAERGQRSERSERASESKEAQQSRRKNMALRLVKNTEQ
jgi:hypothetical protein